MLAGAWNATASQLLSAQDDLLRLMEDARAQGSENLSKQTGRMAGPKLDLSLKPPSFPSSGEIAATLYVMWDGLRRAATDAGDQINRLNAWLSECADPVSQEFVHQLSALVTQIRPQDAPPGPYAPGPVEAAGPAGHTALLHGYTVEIAARFRPEVDLIKTIFDGLPSTPSGLPDFGPLAVNVEVGLATTSAPEAPTLAVTYPARGQNADEAGRFALALFERDRSGHAMAEPETLNATTEDAPSPV